MKLSIILLLVVVTVGLALPQQPRNARRLFPRRKTNAATNIEEEPIAEEPVATVEEPVTPKFRIRGNRKPSSFTPRKSATTLATSAPRISITTATPPAGRPSFSSSASRPHSPQKKIAASPRKVSPAAPAPPRVRGRGAVTFLESIADEDLMPEQIEGIRKATTSGDQKASRPSSSSRPKSRPSGSISSRTPSRPSIRPIASRTADNTATTVESKPSIALVMDDKPDTDKQSSRQQRLLQLKKHKRPRVGPGPKSDKIEDESMPAKSGKQMMAEPEVKDMMPENDNAAEAAVGDMTKAKLDEQVAKPLDKTIKDVKNDATGKQMMDKNEESVFKTTLLDAEEAVKTLPAAVEAEPETPISTTTTAAPASSRAVSSIARIRANRPSASRPRTSRPNRQRASTRVVDAAEVSSPAATPVEQPTGSTRRGSRRGGADAPATPARRPSTRFSSRGNIRSRVDDQEETAAAEETSAAPAPRGRLANSRRG